MGIRKFRADYLFTGKELLNNNAVLITNTDGFISDIIDVADAGENVETYSGIITPGFINTHCHLELSHMKGKIPAGTGLIEFLTRVIRERNFKEEDITSAMHLAEAEMYQAGIVAVGDICNTTDSIRIKKNSHLSWYNFIEVIGFNAHDAVARIDYANKIANEFINASSLAHINSSSQYNTSLSPHAPYSVSQKLFELLNETSSKKTITIHNQESNAENELYHSKTGQLFELYKNLNIDAGPFNPTAKTSLQSYLPWLEKAAAIILVHDVCTNLEDLLFVRHHTTASHEIYFCICINANHYIQSINPPIDLLRNQQCTLTLGTDSYASNHQLNILEEMKTIHNEFPEIPIEEILQWATINGAKALGMDGVLGSFESGKQPGIVLINELQHQHLSVNSSARRLL